MSEKTDGVHLLVRISKIIEPGWILSKKSTNPVKEPTYND